MPLSHRTWEPLLCEWLSQTWQWSGRPTSPAFWAYACVIEGGPPLTAGVRHLHSTGPPEESYVFSEIQV